MTGQSIRIVGIALTATVVAGCATAGDRQQVRLVRVVDGDSLQVEMGDGSRESVRLLGIDAPESYGEAGGEYLGVQAALRVEELLRGRPSIALEPDPLSGDRDNFGRLLRYVWLEADRCLNEDLLRDGLAYALTLFPLSRAAKFEALEQQAREAGRGVWQAEGLAALRWNRDHGPEPLRLHPMGNRSWGIQHGDWWLPGVRDARLYRELEALRRRLRRPGDAPIEDWLVRRGYSRISPASHEPTRRSDGM